MPDDDAIYSRRLTELFDDEIDEVFDSQYVGESGRWAFTNPDTHEGDELEARLFYDNVNDLYYLAFRPSKTDYDARTNIQTVMGAGVPEKFQQAARLMKNIRPVFLDRIVLVGHSLGGGLAAYASRRAYTKAGWKLKTIAFDPLGLNQSMMTDRGPQWFNLIPENLSDRYRNLDNTATWYWIDGSWVADLNRDNRLSSIGKVWELPQDPVHVRKPGASAHDVENVGYGLRYLWDHDSDWRRRETTLTSQAQSAARSSSPDQFSVADELIKLKSLLDAKAISPAEYSMLKGRLIGD